MNPSSNRVPILRILGGAILVLAGLLAYFRVGFGPYAALIFVLGGVALIVVFVLGHRARAGDIALVVIAVLVLSGVTSGGGYGQTLTSVSATRAQVHGNAISLTVSANFGSVDVSFTDKPGLAYQVNFSRPVPFFDFWPGGGDTVTNSTGGGTFNLDVQSGSAAVTVLLGRSYAVDVDLTANTGSVSFEALGNETLGHVSLSSSTGSVSAIVDTSSIQSLALSAGTGSVSLASDNLGTLAKSVPVTLSASTGSVSLRADVHAGDSVSLSASTNLGSVDHSLTGFTVTQDSRTNLAATAGTSAGARGSFVISATSNLGSVSVTVSASP